MEIPANWPNLNSISKVWSQVEDKPSKNYCELYIIRGDCNLVKKTIKEAITNSVRYGVDRAPKTRDLRSYPRPAPLNCQGRAVFFGIPCPCPRSGPGSVYQWGLWRANPPRPAPHRKLITNYFELLDPKAFDTLIRLMVNEIEAIIKADGWYTKY